MPSYNKSILIGNVTRDTPGSPDFRLTRDPRPGYVRARMSEPG
jgi:hypothetical protein